MTRPPRSRRLVVDVGNTSVSAAICPRDGREWEGRFRLPTDRSLAAAGWERALRGALDQAGIDAATIGAAAVASVVPPVDGPLSDALGAIAGTEPFVFDPRRDAGMPIDLLVPSEIGADRLLDAFAARERFGAPVIVVDFGTATTLDVVTADGHYAGGVIAAGLLLTADALSERTAKLPRVTPRRPEHVVGRSTVEAMESGLWHGHVAFVEGMVEKIAAEIGVRPPVVATGGLAVLFAEVPGLFTAIDPDLTLEGLRLAARRFESAR